MYGGDFHFTPRIILSKNNKGQFVKSPMNENDSVKMPTIKFFYVCRTRQSSLTSCTEGLSLFHSGQEDLTYWRCPLSTEEKNSLTAAPPGSPLSDGNPKSFRVPLSMTSQGTEPTEQMPFITY